MAKKRYTPETIIRKLREAEVLQGEGQTIAQVVKQLGVAEQTFYRWRKEYGGLRVDQAKRLKDLEAENARLKRAVADLTVSRFPCGPSYPFQGGSGGLCRPDGGARRTRAYPL